MRLAEKFIPVASSWQQNHDQILSSKLNTSQMLLGLFFADNPAWCGSSRVCSSHPEIHIEDLLSDHALMNLSNELRKRDILSLFLNSFNKFNKTRA